MIGAPLLDLDQHPGGPGRVDLGLAEADRRRPVGVFVELLVQLLRLGEEALCLLPEPQLQVDVERPVEVGGERPLVSLSHRTADRPAEVAVELATGDLAVGDGLGDRIAERGATAPMPAGCPQR